MAEQREPDRTRAMVTVTLPRAAAELVEDLLVGAIGALEMRAKAIDTDEGSADGDAGRTVARGRTRADADRAAVALWRLHLALATDVGGDGS